MTGDDRDASARRLWRERSDSNRHGDSFKGCWPTIGPLSDNPSGKLQFTDCSSEPEPEGFEPPASPLRECSDRMSYVTMNNRPEGVVRVVERPGFEPGLSVLQTDVQTGYTISRAWMSGRESNPQWLLTKKLCCRYTTRQFGATAIPVAQNWLRRRESNSRSELMRLVVPPDTRHNAVHHEHRSPRLFMSKSWCSQVSTFRNMVSIG